MAGEQWRIDWLAKILKEEYGIVTKAQFDEAFKNLPKLNIAPFVSIPKEERRCEET